MNRRLIRAAVAGLSLAAAAAPLAHAGPADDQAIRAVEQGVAGARSVDDLAPYYAPDVVLYDGQIPDVFRGRAAVLKNFAAQLGAMKSIKVEIKELDVGSEGNLGYAFSRQHAVIQMKDGQTLELRFRATDVLRKVDGRWLITHEHISYPADAKTGKTVFNGEF